MIFYILILLIVSLLIAYFQYFYKSKSNRKIIYFLFVLKALALFFIFILLYNPSIERSVFVNQKPKLNVLVDNSKSIEYLNVDSSINDVVFNLVNNENLTEKFDIQLIPFDLTLKFNDSINFSGLQTNIYDAIKNVNEINKDDIGALLLLTDGNQTLGMDYQYFNSSKSIYPIVFGDTLKYRDVNISSLNVNKYSYLNNEFPIEAILNYNGSKAENLRFTILKNGNMVFSKKIQFTSLNQSVVVNTNLKSEQQGLQFYEAKIENLEDEKNTQNNSESFSIEVIDQQSNIAILSSILHPDIGALKRAIESNKQRKVEVFIDDFKELKIDEYQMVVIYQPNAAFQNILKKLSNDNKSFLLVTGSQTDWEFVNSLNLGIQKNAISQTEEYLPIFNNSFLAFNQEDIGFNQFPPLTDKFGEVYVSKTIDNLILQSINGIETSQPLFSFLENNSQKIAILLGEGIWKWRASSFRLNNTFFEFDKFVGNIVQLLSSKKSRNRLDIEINPMYLSNQPIEITAFYTDKNYEFDSRANLQIEITNEETRKTSIFPFSLDNNSYESTIENLEPGNYLYEVQVIGQNLKKSGVLKVNEFSIEEQFLTANKKKLEQLAFTSNGKLYHKSEVNKLIAELLENRNYYTIQKKETSEENILDWRWLLLLIVFLLSTEWFIRKYIGKI